MLALRAQGYPVADIAAALSVQERTVKFHLGNIYAKLQVRRRSQAARQAALARYRHEATVPAAQEGASQAPLPRRPLFRPDRKLTEVVGRGRFTLSAEVTPPRNGVEQWEVLDQVGRLIDAGAQFLAVTKGAGGSL